MSVIEAFRDFLNSGKNSESLSDDLRDAITVPTGLEEALQSAVSAGKDVIVAGSAGGGKTHLARTLSASFPVVEAGSESDGSPASYVLFVPDMTAVPADERERLLTERRDAVSAAVVAVNEGPLHRLARADNASDFAVARQLLHDAQQGMAAPYDAEKPVLVDVGGFDVLADNVVSNLLALDLLREVVESEPCPCEAPEVCPRRRAWRLLDVAEVRKRVGEVLRLVNVGGETVLFRELWDFVADVALGGSCRDDPASSPWFWRVFNGDSELSRRLRTVADPAAAVMPRIDVRLAYGDWVALEDVVYAYDNFLPLDSEPPYEDLRYRWLKSQLFFVSTAASPTAALSDQFDVGLFLELGPERTEELVRTINEYMSYRATSRPDELLLWVDMGVERRLERPEGQAALGVVRTDDLEIRRSFAVANHPDASKDYAGSRRYLVHEESSATLHLTPEKMNLLRGGRSYRVSDRPHTDLEWQIGRFFTSVAETAATVDRLRVFRIDFNSMRSTTSEYTISADKGYLEPNA